MIKIHIDNNNNFNFSLQADNGFRLLNSITFSDKMELDRTLRKLDTMDLTRNHFERKTNTDGRFHFLLKNDDGQTIGQREPYDSEAGMENGIKNLRERLESLS
ncbi:MAG: YegP family protein [Pricia sp.]